ncbi:MAG: RNA polymerase sigma factor [Oscillospiraceae bacterium]|nr:RNA polymerase sigma factor [Oscillospiraceae bacterium]
MISAYLSMMETDPDREWFARVYRANCRQMTRLAVQLLGPGPRAEDAVHDAFVKLIQHCGDLRDRQEARVAGWLAVVVKNTALDMLRKEQHETALDGTLWEPAVPADEGEFHALVALIRNLPEDYRRVLELRFVAEWSLAEIAQAMDLTENTVKTRIFRGRKLLMEQLRKEGYLDGRAYL